MPGGCPPLAASITSTRSADSRKCKPCRIAVPISTIVTPGIGFFLQLADGMNAHAVVGEQHVAHAGNQDVSGVGHAAWLRPGSESRPAQRPSRPVRPG